jgi:hypothetical protein
VHVLRSVVWGGCSGATGGLAVGKAGLSKHLNACLGHSSARCVQRCGAVHVTLCTAVGGGGAVLVTGRSIVGRGGAVCACEVLTALKRQCARDADQATRERRERHGEILPVAPSFTCCMT